MPSCTKPDNAHTRRQMPKALMCVSGGWVAHALMHHAIMPATYAEGSGMQLAHRAICRRRAVAASSSPRWAGLPAPPLPPTAGSPAAQKWRAHECATVTLQLFPTACDCWLTWKRGCQDDGVTLCQTPNNSNEDKNDRTTPDCFG